MKDDVSPHANHRARLRERFTTDGAESLDDLTLLELALTYALPRKDVRPLAAILLERFGSLSSVVNATKAQLTEVDGVSENTAVLFLTCAELIRRLSSRPPQTDLCFFDKDVAGRFVLSMLKSLPEEHVCLLCLTDSGSLISSGIIHRGSVSSAAFSVRSITEKAILSDCRYVVLGHNHPNGTLIPSDADLLTTKQIALSLRTNGIKLCEHFIIAGDKYLPIRLDKL